MFACCFCSRASCLCYDVLNLNFRRFNMFAVVSIGENIFRPFDTYLMRWCFCWTYIRKSAS